MFNGGLPTADYKIASFNCVIILFQQVNDYVHFISLMSG